jgi:adenylosuccinate synthase
MQNVKVVIGSGFGGEGKGKVTNMYAKDWAGIVVRHNGGCQSTHTVEHKEGFRHVFSHLGSASINGVPTYLSQYFVLNPERFLNELDILSFRNGGVSISDVYVDGHCIVTIPYDILINQALEISRGSNRHGSSGFGFHETILRNQNPSFSLTINEARVLSSKNLYKKLKVIRDEYTINRLKDLNITVPEHLEFIMSESNLKNTIDCIFMFLDAIKIVNVLMLSDFYNVVFEGASGLSMDEDSKWYPHVTHAKTGVINVLRIMNSIGKMHSIIDDDRMEVTYVTRPYMTRHGAGPFPSESPTIPEFDAYDRTNKSNQFQGVLRVGYLDVYSLKNEIQYDCGYIPKKIFTKLHMTCMDQILTPKTVPYVSNYCEGPIIRHCHVDSIPTLFTNIVDGFEFSSSPFSD